MREWMSLTPIERQSERDKIPNPFRRRIRMEMCAAAVLALLQDDPAAQKKVGKVNWGNYLINTPEEIAAHCRAAAHGAGLSGRTGNGGVMHGF